jgi:hypothetical protein
MTPYNWRVLIGIVLAGLLVNGGWWLLQRRLFRG